MNKSIVFTIISKNYFAQAITLYKSILITNKGIDFKICLIDDLTEEEVQELGDIPILHYSVLDSLLISDFKKKYNIIEFNTAVKPFFIEHFFLSGYQNVVYLDPDIFVYDSLNKIFSSLEKYSYILTPHFFTPIHDDKLLTEAVCLQTGTFNLGFFAIKNDEIGRNLIDWWQLKLKSQCWLKEEAGFFVDQKWMNLSIAYFDNYLIDKDPGLNAAHWNLHERAFSKNENNEWVVNNTDKLLFFHFSSYKPELPNKIAAWHNRFTFQTRSDIIPLFSDYRTQLIDNGYFTWSKKQCALNLKAINTNSTNKFALLKQAIKNYLK